MIQPEIAPSVCIFNGKIYVTGGAKDGVLHGGDYGDSLLQIYDIQADSWTSGANMPEGRLMHGSAIVDSIIYCIGGGWNNPVANNMAYDITTGTWASKASMPTLRTSLGVAAVDDKIYAIGGFGSGSLYNLNEMYDPLTDTWTTRASMPTARTGFGTTVVDGKIYVIGGCLTPSYPLTTVEVYDPQTNTWQTKSDMPSARFGLALASVGKKIYAMGGTPTNVVPSPGKFEVYNTETNTWENLPDLPNHSQWSAGGSWGDKVYIMGGEDMCMFTYPDQATIFDFLFEYKVSVGIGEENHSGNDTYVLHASPNPFHNETTLSFEIPDKTHVKLELFNLLGEKIQTLVNDLKPQGMNSAVLNGFTLPTGIYLCRLSADNKTVTLKLSRQ